MSAGRPVVVGVVGRPWGIRGQFLLDPIGTDPTRWLAKGVLRLRRGGAATSDHRVLESHTAAGKLVVQIEGCTSIDEARELKGAEVVLTAAELDPAPEGSFYPHELIGLEVVTVVGARVGKVERVLQTGGPDLLGVRFGTREVLVPFAAAICRRVDPESGTIEIDPPEGLLELG